LLAEVNLAEEGVLQLLLASIHRLSSRTGSGNEAAVSSKYVLFPVKICLVIVISYINKLGLSFEIHLARGNISSVVYIYLLNNNNFVG